MYPSLEGPAHPSIAPPPLSPTGGPPEGVSQRTLASAADHLASVSPLNPSAVHCWGRGGWQASHARQRRLPGQQPREMTKFWRASGGSASCHAGQRRLPALRSAGRPQRSSGSLLFTSRGQNSAGSRLLVQLATPASTSWSCTVVGQPVTPSPRLSSSAPRRI